MTPVFCCGFECGLSTSPGALDYHFGTSGAATFDTSVFRSGLRSGKLNPSAVTSTNFTKGNLLAGTRQAAMRFYRRFDVNPAAQVAVGGFTVGGTIECGLVFSASYFAGSDDGSSLNAGSAGIPITAGDGIWHLIEIKLDTSANPWLVNVSVDGFALAQSTRAVAATDITSVMLGHRARTSTYTFYDDDVLVSFTAADHPLGGGKVLSFVPNADGTHTSTTSEIVKGTAAAPTGGGNVAGATDVFNWLNNRPIGGGATDATRLVNQQTVAATHYAEVQFEDTVEVNPPRAVEVLTVDQQATTAAGSFITKLNDNGTEDAIITRASAAGVITDRYATKQYATMVGGGAWTLARFNGLRARFGYSGDATPDQYWRGIMIEAEFPESQPASSFGRPEGQRGQNQMRQLLAQ